MNQQNDETERNSPEIENQNVRSRDQASDIQETEGFEMEQDKPSTSKTPNVQKFKSEAICLLETLADASSKESIETSPEKD